ncbi:hypothetical protein LTR37_020787 [Vermiconidia calcicola]|uniref:Uncharacterized protein n=1 Tax=Vermiconidia calcicola TaxID=1690605 RepID=A0ACC3MCA4_9PEZI|nr:hypothetical protein LTR37_020787 [Vermiconidia calcicola]
MNLLNQLKPSKKQDGHHQKLPRSSVVVPLHMYPLTEETWEPLYKAIRSHPELQFIIIVNPNSGPGAPPWWPDPGYVREIPRLNAFDNVCTLGYVRIDYCHRPQDEVLADIRAYGKWTVDEVPHGTFVRGIFFDESPNNFSLNGVKYLETISDEVRRAEGIDHPRCVLQNPGTLPEERLVAPSRPDITAVCEETLERYHSYSPAEKVGIGAWPRSQCCMILHTVPKQQIRPLVRELRQRAAYLFITELGIGACYQKWGSGWEEFIDAMASVDP